jgi:methyltransferase (TIGR00027 family)
MTEITTEITNVTGTAFVVAEFRAEENDAAQPLYRDNVVSLFLSPESRRAADRAADGFPLMKELVKLRTRYFDDMLDRQIASGCEQVVVLGAGLDTRAIRKASADVTYFEIDDAATLELKRARLAEHGMLGDTRFIPGNYVTDGLITLLLMNGFDPELPTYLIWEGNTMYLPLSCDKAILRQLKGNLKSFHVSFDYFAEAMIAKSTGVAGLTRMTENFERMNAPWVTGFDDVEALAGEVDLRLIDNITTAELHREYRPRSEAPVFGPYYSVCTLRSQAA